MFIKKIKFLYLKTRYKNQRIILYGGGLLCEELLKTYDLKKSDIIGIADRKFENAENEEIFGYKGISPISIFKHKPDIILITMLHPCVALDFLNLNFCNELKFVKVASFQTRSLSSLIHSLIAKLNKFDHTGYREY